MIHAHSWLLKRIETIFEKGFCRIMCRDTVTHLVVSEKARRKGVKFAQITWRLPVRRRLQSGVIFCQINWREFRKSSLKNAFRSCGWLAYLCLAMLCGSCDPALAAWDRG